MNRKERRAAEAAARKQPQRRLPLAPEAYGLMDAFHARRVAAAEALRPKAGAAAALRVAREALAFGEPLMAHNAGETPPACAKGCHFCCHNDVAASVPEAALVADRLRRSLDGDTLAALRAKLAEGEEAMPSTQPLRASCAFLGEGGACSVYEVRPLACRGWTSLDVSACERSYATGEASGPVPTDPGRMSAARAVSAGVWTGAADVGLDGRPVGFVRAVRAALEDGDWIERWSRGEPTPDHLVHESAADTWAESSRGYPPLARSVAIVAKLSR
jgi:hypothetical protein